SPGHIEDDRSFRRVLKGSDVYFTIGQVVMAGAVAPGRAGHAETQIGPRWRHETQLASLGEHRDQLRLASFLFAPGSGRVWLVQEHGPYEYALVLACARICTRGPAKRPLGATAKKDIRERPAGLLPERPASGIDRVPGWPSRNGYQMKGDISNFDRAGLHRIDKAKLIDIALQEHQLLACLWPHENQWVATCLQHFAIHSREQRLGGRRADQADDLAGTNTS